MKGFLWISLLLGFLLIAQGLPVDEEGTNPDERDEYQDDQDEESEDEEKPGPPPVLRSKNRTFSVLAGDSFILPCQVDNSESGVVMWWSGANIMFTGPTSTVFHENERPNMELLKNHSIYVRNIRPEEVGTYSCEVIKGDKKSSVQYYVGVIAKPQITQTSPSQPKNVVQKGSPITLSCSATGSPPPKISFIKKAKHGSHEEFFEGPTLTIDSATRKNSGTYLCKAENDGGVDTKPIEIQVHYKPEVEAVKDFVNTDEGHDIELICNVHSEPKAQVEWFKDSKKLEDDNLEQQQHTDKRKHVWKLQDIKPEDFGMYQCVATNNLGSSFTFIEVSGRPSKPIFQKASASADGKSPELTWKVESISPIHEYELLYRMQDSQSGWKSTSPVVEKVHDGVYTVRHILSGLQSQSYQTQLKAKNSYGWSALSDLHTFSGHIEAPQEEPSAQEPLESEKKDSPASAASPELRISFALILSLLIARFYC